MCVLYKMYIKRVIYLQAKLQARPGTYEHGHPRAHSRISTCSSRSLGCLVLCKSNYSDVPAWRRVPVWGIPLCHRAVSLIQLSNKSFHLKPQARAVLAHPFLGTCLPGDRFPSITYFGIAAALLWLLSLSSCHYITLPFPDIKQVVSYILWVSSMGWDL